MSQSNVKLFSLVTWPTIKLARTKLSKLFHYSVPKMSWMRPLGLRDLRRPLIQLWSLRNQLIWFLQPQQPQWPQHLSRCVKGRVEVYHGLLVMILSIHLQKKTFKCNICETEFAIQSGLKEHIITVHERKQPIQPVYERPRCVQCHFCAKRFDLQASLDEHIISVHK